jgi:hypothetical protein
LEGALVAMVEVALGSDATGAKNSKTALRRLHLDDGSCRSVKVVAGTRYQRYLHLDWVALSAIRIPSTGAPPPIACTLTGDDFAARTAWIRQLARDHLISVSFSTSRSAALSAGPVSNARAARS